MFRLDANSPLPLYFQLAKKIEQNIINGQWSVNETISSERDLMQMAGVSRHTVRQAIAYLVEQGVLKKIHGKGTFVNLPKIEVEQGLNGYAQEIETMGMVGRDHFIETTIVEATSYLASTLNVSVGKKLNYFKRVRFLNQTRILVGISYIPHHLCPDLLDRGVRPSLYRQLKEDYNLPILRSVDTIESIPADEEIAQLLCVKSGFPLLYLHRLAYSRDDLPVQVNHVYGRGDMFRVRANLTNSENVVEQLADGSSSNYPYIDSILE